MNTANTQSLRPFGIMMGVDRHPNQNRVDEPQVGSTLPLIWEDEQGDLSIMYLGDGAESSLHPYGYNAQDMLQTPQGLWLGMHYNYDRKPGLADYHVRKLPLKDGTEQCQKRLNRWAIGERRRRYGGLSLKVIKGVYSPDVVMLTDTIAPRESWMAYMLPNGKLLVGPVDMVHREMKSMLIFGLDQDQKAYKNILIALIRYYGQDVPRDLRIRGLKAYYDSWPRQLRGRNQRSNTQSWATTYFGLDRADVMALPWMRYC